MSSEPLTYEQLWGTPPPDSETDHRGHQNPDSEQAEETEHIAEAQLSMLRFCED